MARKKLFDCADQKFDPGASGMVSTDGNAGILEAYNKATELKGYKEARVDQGNVSGALAYDLSVANVYSSVINGAITGTTVTPTTDHYTGTLHWQIVGTFSHDLTDFKWTSDQGAPPMTDGDEYLISLHRDPFGTGFIATWTPF